MSIRAPHLSRRQLLGLSGAGAAVLALGVNAPGSASAAPLPHRENLFGLGVASGYPRPDGVVLWTRLAPEPLAEDGHGGMPLRPVPVKWEVAETADFRRIVARGTALAQPELAHSVHPRVEGLKAGTEHYYRFTVGPRTSPVGRFRTLPAAGDAADRFSVGLISCQAWYHGHFSAHRHLAQEEDLDLTVFLGDYIYEYGITSANLWRQGAEVTPAHAVETETLEQYRLRYALTKSDPHLQALHARAASVAIWDDHEVQNNYVAAESATGISAELFAHRIAVAYRAFYENLPVDLDALPTGPESDILAGIDVGTLARITLMDTRQYRDAPPTDEADRARDDRSMLGANQERWVTNRLRTSRAQWNVLAGGVVLAPVSEDRHDQWDGYPAARRRLLREMRRSGNAVMLTGDIHKHVAAELRGEAAGLESGPAGVELVATSAASDGDGARTDKYTKDWTRHDYVRHYDGRRGYLHVMFTSDQLTSSFWVVPWVESDDTAPKELSARFTTPAGSSRLIED
ncbi:alkaline phosphatase D [Micrococcus cohnii]|uniref:Alkaline phosphatase D n=1 Tax=Micrococcus cohnii TaxID=993416 RepID=A0A7W7GPY5_9MICC|nr:alkaline phosphatase D family protein [Micrococcus cohnii]MBB4736176.1 alkaline phosphatase D [Micrococcus cohnii]